MKIKFWGVRGSLPAIVQVEQTKINFTKLITEFLKSGKSQIDQIEGFLKSKKNYEINGHGTATTCVQISDGDQNLIIDGGSGLKAISDLLAQNNNSQKEHHILMSHFHFDHILGLPFFMPHFMKNHTIHYYSVHPECEKVVRSLFQKPIFPVTFEQLQAKIIFHQIKPYEKNKIAGFDVTAYGLDHPDPCSGFRVEKNGRAYAHAVDHEIERITAEQLKDDAGLFKNIDLLYIDAQYIESDMVHKKGWGHGTFDRAFQVCAEFNVQQVLLAHHDPSANDQDINRMSTMAQLALEQKSEYHKIKNMKWSFAFEGQEIEL